MQTQTSLRLWAALAWLLVVGLGWWSLHPLPWGIRFPYHLDKLAHLCSFALVGGLWFHLFAGFLWRPAGLAYGVALEVGQAWVPGRSFDYLDLAANLTGIALAWIWVQRRSRRAK